MVVRRQVLWRIVKIAVSALLIAALMRAADWPTVLETAAQLDLGWLGAALLLFVPQTLLSAWRWQRLVAPIIPLTFADSLRHTLLANAMNLIVPAKGGDFSKAAWLTAEAPHGRTRAAARVLLEKLTDVGCLLYCVALGLRVDSAWLMMLLLLALMVLLASRDRRVWRCERLLPAFCATILLWALHLAQVHAFLRSAGVDATWVTTLARVPLALFAGLVPGTFCGIGTRDSAFVWLYADVASAATMAVVGLLTSLRYLIPGAAGIIVLGIGRPTTAAHPAVSTSPRLAA